MSTIFNNMHTIYVFIDNSVCNASSGTRIREIDDFIIKCYDFKDYDYD